MRRVLITGPSGFIGRLLLKRLLPENCEIHAVNRLGAGDHGDRVTWHASDLRNSSEATELVANVQPTHLLHGAWIATPRIYVHSPENFDWLNASIALMAAFGANGGSRFVGIGSSAEYAPNSSPSVEDVTPIGPRTIYGKCKAAFWLSAQALSQHYDFSAAWGRLFLPYGPGDPAERLVPSVIAALRAGTPVDTTHGEQKRDFIYAADAADLLVRLLFSKETGAFNIGTGKATTIRSVVEYLAVRCRKPDMPRFGARPTAEGEPAFLVADMRKVQERLLWSSSTDVWSGLDMTLSCFDSNGLNSPEDESDVP